MVLELFVSIKEETLRRRLIQIFGLDNYISEPGANLEITTGNSYHTGKYISLGTCNNVAYKKFDCGIYHLWLRDELYKEFNENRVIAIRILEQLL